MYTIVFTKSFVQMKKNIHTQSLDIPPQFSPNSRHTCFLGANITDRLPNLVLEEEDEGSPEDDGAEGEEVGEGEGGMRAGVAKPYE